jgi:ADP-ribose pyrophosphatase
MTTSNKKLHWKVLQSEYLFKEPWLTVRRDSVELRNGHRIPAYYVLEYPEWVNVIAITKEKQFVFVRQYRHGIRSVNFELCAGVCEKEDDSPLISAQRELLEETGYGNGVWEEYMTVSANPSTMNNLCHCFLARDVEKINEQHLDETEELSIHLLSLEEVKDLLENNEIKQSLMAAPLWKLMAREGESSHCK